MPRPPLPALRWTHALVLAGLALFPAATARAELPPLIPRELLFSNPQRGAPRLSPDGLRLAFLERDRAGVMQLRIATFGSTDTVTVTRGPRGAGACEWSGDGTALLFLKDRDGDEDLHLWTVAPEGGEPRDLTPFPNVRAEGLEVDPAHPGEVLVGLNRRDPKVFDVHRVTLASGEVALDTGNPGDVLAWTADSRFQVRACTALDPADGATVLRVRPAPGEPWREIARWSFEDAGNDRFVRILGFGPGDSTLYVQSPVHANTTSLVLLSARDGRLVRRIASHSGADLWNQYDPASPHSEVVALWHPRTGAPQAVAFEELTPIWRVLDRAVAADLERLEKLGMGFPTVTGRDRDDRRWLVEFDDDDHGERFGMWLRDEQRLEPLFETHPQLAPLALAAMRGVWFRARDGMRIPAYLTLPPGVPARKLPLVLSVHGGPWFRDSWGFNPEVQWLANRGYAVLQVNFRGSTGFGRDFLNASTHQMGTGAMQHDLVDGVRWAIEQGIADPARVAVMGGSYGGYAALAGLAFTPEVFACGVSIVGPSNLATMIESFPPYWATRRTRWIRRIGDVVADSALNRRLSPLFHADAMRAPLLVFHGANDPRVKQSESDRIVAALRARGVAVEYVVYPDEGHGMGREENVRDAVARIEAFFAKHLGGRAEPGGPIAGTSAELR